MQLPRMAQNVKPVRSLSVSSELFGTTCMSPQSHGSTPI
jgi:hypothetical protein